MTSVSLIFECQCEQLFPTVGDKLSEIRHIMNPTGFTTSTDSGKSDLTSTKFHKISNKGKMVTESIFLDHKFQV